MKNAEMKTVTLKNTNISFYDINNVEDLAIALSGFGNRFITVSGTREEPEVWVSDDAADYIYDFCRSRCQDDDDYWSLLVDELLDGDSGRLAKRVLDGKIDELKREYGKRLIEKYHVGALARAVFGEKAA